jgi:hypothetical protein
MGQDDTGAYEPLEGLMYRFDKRDGRILSVRSDRYRIARRPPTGENEPRFAAMEPVSPLPGAPVQTALGVDRAQP